MIDSQSFAEEKRRIVKEGELEYNRQSMHVHLLSDMLLVEAPAGLTGKDRTPRKDSTKTQYDLVQRVLLNGSQCNGSGALSLVLTSIDQTVCNIRHAWCVVAS